MTAGQFSGLPYDTLAYAHTLPHLGRPACFPGLPWPVIIRAIPDSDRCDAIGPWPYGSPIPADQAAVALSELRVEGIVSLLAVFRPDQAVDAAGLRAAGLDCVRLKDHFVFQAHEPRPEPSKKTRHNLAAARRCWSVQCLDLCATWPVLADWHHELSQRRAMSKFAQVETRHFERLAAVPGAAGLGVFDGDELVAALVVVLTEAAVHFHAVVGNERAYRERAFYALYDAAVARWGGERLLCLGGVPSGPDSDGVGKFKRRFATSTRPALMATAILDEPAAKALAARRSAPSFFPPYRTWAE